MKIIERTYNIESGETTEFERDLTPTELDEVTRLRQLAELASEAEAAKAAARQAVLDRLGITADEAALILGGVN